MPLPFSRQSLVVFWSIVPSAQDIVNLATSGVATVMLTYRLMRDVPDVTIMLLGKGKHLICRLTKEDLRDVAPDVLVADIKKFEAACKGNLVYVIAGNEPDNGFEMDYASRTGWGNEAHNGQPAVMWDMRYKFIKFGEVYKQSGITVPLCSGGFTNQMPRPTVAPYPGTFVWYREFAPVFNDSGLYDARALHLYTDSYLSGTDMERLQSVATVGASMWKPPFIIDEIGIRAEPESRRIDAYLDFGTWLLRPEQQAPGKLGRYVAYLAPFIANGTGIGYPPEYIIKEPRSYVKIANWIVGGGGGGGGG